MRSPKGIFKWNLDFKDKKYEKLFAESKSRFQKPASRIAVASILITCLLAWIVNPLNQPLYQGVTLGFMITLLIFSFAFFVYSCKAKVESRFEMATMLLIFYFMIGILESVKNTSAKKWGRLYYFNIGALLQFMLVSMILARIGWLKNIICFLAVILLFVFRYTPFEENFESKFYPLVMQFENFLFLCFVAYIMEKGERLRFHERKSYENSLNSFKELITDFIPIPIFILNSEELVFFNKETEKLFNTQAKSEIYESLEKMRLKRGLLNENIFEDYIDKNFNNDYLKLEVSAQADASDDHSSFSDCLTYCFRLLSSDGNVSVSAQGFLMSPETNQTKFFEVKFKDVFWDGAHCVMIIIEESESLEKIKLLKEQMEYKNKLLATVSHDLRTPLYGIIGMISCCNEVTSDPLIKKNLNIALRSSYLLNFMINDILDYSQISNGKLRLNNEFFSPWQVIKEVSKLIKFQAKKKGVQFIKENKMNDERNPCLIKNDQNRMKQVLLNLLNNALKFTDQGLVKVSLESAAWHEQTSQKSKKSALLIKVTDSGIGIEREEIPNLFHLLGKSKNTKSVEKNKSGIGLGLAISKSLLETLNEDPGGKHIFVESEYGKGSTFSFLIKSVEDKRAEEEYHSENNEFLELKEKPAALPFFQPKYSKANEQIDPHKKHLKVLLVDDDQINIIVGTTYLKTIGSIQFDTAFNGHLAVEKVMSKALQGFFYDCILMDCNMPVMDGLTAASELKEQVSKKILQPVRIVGCTANASLEDKQRCFEAGMDDLLIKPFSRKELEDKIMQN